MYKIKKLAETLQRGPLNITEILSGGKKSISQLQDTIIKYIMVK